MPVSLNAIVSAVAREAGLDPTNVVAHQDAIYQFVNDTRREIADLPQEFKALSYTGELQGIANVTAGTAGAKLNQAEVTGVSTSWTTAMAGRYIQIGTEYWQRISYVSDTTHLTLETDWGNASATGASYKIWTKFYPLPAKVDKIYHFIDSVTNRPANAYERDEFVHKYRNEDTFSNGIVAFTIYEGQELGLAYLDSTVFTGVTGNGTQPILDFSSGAGLVTAMGPGARIRFGDSTTSTAFYIDRILTDTKVAIRGYLPQSVVGSCTAFQVDRNYVQFYPAQDNTLIFRYNSKKRLQELISGQDFIEEGWYEAVKAGAIAKALGWINSPKEQQKILAYQQAVAKLIRNDYRAQNPFPRLTPIIPSRYGSSSRLFGSNRDE